MILEQHYLACLSQASYMVGDAEAGVAAVVDPRRDVEIYREAAAKHGVKIQHVLLTHFHADFLAGHLELAAETGATLHLGAAASAEFDFEPLADGARLQLGAVSIEAVATPGHTPESTSYVVRSSKDAQPHDKHGIFVLNGKNEVMKFVHNGNAGAAFSMINLSSGDIQQSLLTSQTNQLRDIATPHFDPIPHFENVLLLRDDFGISAWSSPR